ncbi:MAG TPA: YdcF family protein [Gemmatimonadaceae bacterium]|nr:YdcF family protein [Gemmatimonadaceae bacterium]
MTTTQPLASPSPAIQRVVRLRLWLGGACAILAWLAFGALTGVGKTPSLLYPITVLVALIGALLALTPARVLLWFTTALAVGVFCVIAITPFTTALLPTEKLVRNDALPAQALDAVIVLSEGITPDSLLGPGALDRLLSGLALMRDSVAPVLVVTQPRVASTGATAAPDQARLRALVSRSFPTLTVDSVHTTRDEAVGAWRMLRPRGATRVAVVTSPLHTSRACATFEHVGFAVTCVSAISRAYSVKHADSGQERLALFHAWLYERAAWIEYRWRGWVTR